MYSGRLRLSAGRLRGDLDVGRCRLCDSHATWLSTADKKRGQRPRFVTAKKALADPLLNQPSSSTPAKAA